MKYLLLTTVIFILLGKPTMGQTSFSFNCTKDTLIECTTSCLTLHTVLPDIHASTNAYTVNQLSAISCFRGYVDPAASGPSANLLIDDRYSPPIDITFPFSFYGTTYSQLIASTNGFLSFDISKTGTFSHFGILNKGGSLSATAGVPQDLPSGLYDKAVIMGPYHDLDPNVSLAGQQIKYEVIGTAPYRKWIISYYNEPLYTTACLNLNKNTHQIVLYETLGIVEVFLYNKEICLNWNNGRAMIGMQNATKTSAIMAPGRQASSVPWGNQGMNESWRFVPASGNSLFKKVELYTLGGTFITNGNTSNSNNLINVSFPNICPPSTGGSYLVKSYYQNPSGAGPDVIGTDTIIISRGDPIVTDLQPAGCAASSLGVITVTNPVGANYEYSLDGLAWQASNVFNTTAGNHMLRTRIIGSSCISSKTITVNVQSFEASIVKIVTPCPGPLTASVFIYPTHGTPQYNYSLNGSALQTSNIFTNLAVGDYDLRVTDAGGCIFTAQFRIDSVNLATANATNTICGMPPSGTITVTAGFGILPYTYSINGNAFQSSNIFTGVASGNYTITIRDSTTCTYSFDAVVKSDVQFNINPTIQMPVCSGNKNGRITLHPSLGQLPYKFSLDNSPFQADSVYKDLGANTYVVHVQDGAGCVKDSSVIVQQPNPVSGSLVVTPATTCLASDGEINVKANGGVTPFTFSIDNGATYQVSNVFNVLAGVFNIIIKDSNDCKASIVDTVIALRNTITVDAGPDQTICVGSTASLSVKANRPVTLFNWSPSSSLDNPTSATPRVNPTDTTTYFITAASEVCSGTDSVRVNVLHKPVADAGKDSTICNNTVGILNGTVTNASGPVSYSWTPPANIQNPTASSTLVYPTTTRPIRYRLEVTDNYGCNFKVFDDVIITMKGPVQAFAGHDTIAAVGLPHQLLGSGGIQYSWTPAHALNDPMAQNPIAVLQNDTRFYLTVTDVLGCIGTSSVFVKVFKGPTYYVPNAFTPNGDGLNDVFKAIAPGIKQYLLLYGIQPVGAINVQYPKHYQGLGWKLFGCAATHCSICMDT